MDPSSILWGKNLKKVFVSKQALPSGTVKELFLRMLGREGS